MRDRYRQKNKDFFVVSVAVSLWAFFSLASEFEDSVAKSELYSQLGFGFGFLVLCSSLRFFNSFGILTESRAILKKWFLWVTVIILAVLFSTDLVYELSSISEFTTGPLYYPYLTIMIGVLLRIFMVVVRNYKNGPEIDKSQLLAITLGLTSAIVLAITTNVAIPALTQSTSTTKIGPFFSILFVASSAYAIIRHKLFNLRLTIARSMAYAFSLSVVAIVISGLVIITSKIVFTGSALIQPSNWFTYLQPQ